ncbi:MAG TPA: nucleotidyltransferase domain-containing protein [Dehalococcoidia bacterium]|nr:nucleotidyltransferase domain-containing protein [Dehalococcoidia bacterium]
MSASEPQVARAVMLVARKAARRMVMAGAEGVALMGSHVRGDAHAESDVDVLAVGRGPAYTLRRSGGILLAETWKTRAQCLREMRTPHQAGWAVPGWREAIVLADPGGVARELRRRAERWSWAAIASRSDAWAADEITGFAEEVHKLAGAILAGQWQRAAIVRNVIAIRMAPLMSVRRRVLYASENLVHDVMAAEMGELWESTQHTALALRGESTAHSCAAALRLYAIAAAELRPLLDRRQRAVVDHACALAADACATT